MYIYIYYYDTSIIYYACNIIRIKYFIDFSIPTNTIERRVVRPQKSITINNNGRNDSIHGDCYRQKFTIGREQR